MIRTQISLTEAQKRRLDEEAATTGLSMSELIRRAVDRCYAPDRDLEADLAAIDAAFGAWKDRDFDGEEYVERLRTGRRLDWVLAGMPPEDDYAGPIEEPPSVHDPGGAAGRDA